MRVCVQMLVREREGGHPRDVCLLPVGELMGRECVQNCLCEKEGGPHRRCGIRLGKNVAIFMSTVK